MPDFRNLGTVLRILVAVNLGAALVALARATQLSLVYAEWIEATGVVEPYLLLVLAVLWAASPWLARMTFSVGAGVIALATILAGRVIFAAMNMLAPLPDGTLLRWVLIGLFAVAILLFYFHLRARARK